MLLPNVRFLVVTGNWCDLCVGDNWNSYYVLQYLCGRYEPKRSYLERVTENDPGGGTMYAKPEEVFKNEIAGIKNLKNDVRGLADEVTTMDAQVADNNLRILVLEERFQYFESTAAKEDVPLNRNNGKMKNRNGK